MFNKKIVPDFSPRPVYVPKKEVLARAPDQNVSLPQNILISDSEKLPLEVFPPPPPRVTAQEIPKPVQIYVTKKVEEVPLSATSLFSAVPAAPTLAPAASFSPSLETFTGTGQSYFKLASDTKDGPQNWWQYPAAGPVDISGFNIAMQGGNIYGVNELVTTTAEISTAYVQYISSQLGSISSFITNIITLDSATLTTAGGSELLLNGIPLATTSNISSIADWSFDPAVSTLNMNGNSVLGAADIQVSSINGGSLSTISAANWATYPASAPLNMNSQPIDNVSTINGAAYPPPISGVTSLNAQSGTVAITSAGNTVTITNPTPGTINLETASGSGAADWANFPAISNVLVPNKDFNMSNTNGGLFSSFNTAYINANVEIGALSNAPYRPTFNAYPDYFNVGSIVSPALGMTFTSLGGVNINSALGVSIAGGGGVAITGVGGINLQGGGAINVASGGILVSGGGIAITAGGMAVNGGGLQVGAGGMAVTGGNVQIATSTSMGTVSAKGGEFSIYGNNIKILPSGSNNAALLTEFIGTTTYAPTMQIVNVSTINDIPFPPPIPGLTPDLTVSTLVAANYVSTPNLYADNLFGTAMNIGNISTGTGITIGTNATEINITADVFIDAPRVLNANEIANVSTITAATEGVTINPPDNTSSILYVDQITSRGGVPGTGDQFLTVTDGRIIWADRAGLVGPSGATGPIGATGPGMIGASGATGPTGPQGQSSSYFNYQAQEPPATPDAGHITWQSTAQTASTYIEVSHLNNDGVDVELFLTAIQVGNTLIIQNKDDSTNFQKWTVSGTPVVVANNYVQYPVTLVSSAGADFNNNHNIILAILAQGVAGPTGPTGPTGPVNTALVNKVAANSVGTPTSTPLIWSPASTANEYVPLAADTSVTYKPPTAPTSGVPGHGWRFTKTYNLITVAVSGLTTGSTYSIVTPGTINWTAIGAAAATAGTQFTYNGVTITGTGGTAVETSKISWYPLNALYGLSLPQTSAPIGAVSKADLQSAWFLVKFNADIALQGSLAIQIETYAYQYGGNTSNSFTGRWAYSFPLQQGQGFNAQSTTNITTGGNPGLQSARLRAGFTYLLYAGDYSTVGAAGSLQPPSSQYLPAGAGLFAPSQTLLTNTLRDPYDIYPDYPHFGMTSCLYTANATQPPYGGANPYSDQAAVEVASIYLNTNSTSPTSGVGQTVTDFQVMAMGYTTSTKSVTFPLAYTV